MRKGLSVKEGLIIEFNDDINDRALEFLIALWPLEN